AYQVSYFRPSYEALWPPRRRGCGVVLTGRRRTLQWHDCCSEIDEATGTLMNRLLIVAILLISTAPMYAQGQQPSMAKLKADAQKVVSIIKGDKAKTQVYCQINDLGEQIDGEQNNKKAEALSQRVIELEKKLGPEYVALVNALKDMDPNSPEGAE